LGEVGGNENTGNSRLYKCCIVRANIIFMFVQEVGGNGLENSGISRSYNPKGPKTAPLIGDCDMILLVETC